MDEVHEYQTRTHNDLLGVYTIRSYNRHVMIIDEYQNVVSTT